MPEPKLLTTCSFRSQIDFSVHKALVSAQVLLRKHAYAWTRALLFVINLFPCAIGVILSDPLGPLRISLLSRCVVDPLITVLFPSLEFFNICFSLNKPDNLEKDLHCPLRRYNLILFRALKS